MPIHMWNMIRLLLYGQTSLSVDVVLTGRGVATVSTHYCPEVREELQHKDYIWNSTTCPNRAPTVSQMDQDLLDNSQKDE